LRDDLIAFATKEFELSALVDGHPVRVHLEKLADLGEPDAIAELDAVPKLSRLASHIWGWFIDLARCRQYAGMGSAMPISYRDVQAWRDVTGAEPEPWELNAIFAIDAAWMAQVAKDQEKKS